MKQKYTLTVADAEINIITDEPKESIDTVVGIVDRRIREINLKSKNCSRIEAALLLCLDYCAEKLKLQKKIKMADAEISRLAALNDAAARENAALTREIETLRQSLNMSTITPPAPTKISKPVQISINEELKDEEPYTPFVEEKIDQDVEEKIEEAPAPEAVIEEEPVQETILEAPVEEAPVIEEPKQEESKKEEPTPKKKRVRSMFDLITFDKL